MKLLYIANFLVLSLLCCIIMKTEVTAKACEKTVLSSETDREEVGSKYSDDGNEVSLGIDTLTNMICSIVIEIVGAFLGFLSALAFANRSNKKQMKELDLSLYNELLVIYKELKDRFMDEDFGDYYCYQTPIWDINLASGSLVLAMNSKIYYKYIQIYSKIQFAQELETEYVHTKLFVDEKKKFADNYIKAIDDARKKEAKSICESIEKNILEEVSKCQE